MGWLDWLEWFMLTKYINLKLCVCVCVCCYEGRWGHGVIAPLIQPQYPMGVSGHLHTLATLPSGIEPRAILDIMEI